MPDGQSKTQQPKTPRPQRQIFPQPAGYHLAQVNLARAVDDLDRPAMAEFMAALDKVNGIASRSPGFVWRQDDPVADARAKEILGDPRETYTLSVWETADALEFFAWKTVHRRFMNNRHKWFVPPDKAFLAMWWIPPAPPRILPRRWRGWNIFAHTARWNAPLAGRILPAPAPGSPKARPRSRPSPPPPPRRTRPVWRGCAS